MHDQARLSQSLLALVPVDGSSIGNQSLFEQLSAVVAPAKPDTTSFV